MDAAPQLSPVLGNPVELQQVILNLSMNALDAMDVNEPLERQLRIRTRAQDGWVNVAVCDQGAGIPQSHLERLFEPFFTTKPQGMGMGLTISHSIVEAHGGRLWAENNADRGATFRFTLPVAEGAAR